MHAEGVKCSVGLAHGVGAYLLAADKYFRLLLIRLDGGTQPVSLTQNGVMF